MCPQMPKEKFYDAILKVRIDRDTLKELKKIAKTKNTKVSLIVRRLIYAEIKKYRTSKPTIPRH